jgi:hypothetical protein
MEGKMERAGSIDGGPRCLLASEPREMAQEEIASNEAWNALSGAWNAGRVACLFPFLLAACAGEPLRLPPRELPPRLMPRVTLPATPLAPRHGRVVLEATDGPMRVVAKYDPSFVPPGGVTEQGRSGELCVTPCVVDLPVGKYRLFLSATEAVDAASGDTDDLVVSEGLQVYRRAPGRYETPTPIDHVGPAAVLIASVTAITVGSVLLAKEDTRAPGVGLVIGGVVGGALGSFWGYNASRATQQDGATTAFQVKQ